MYERAVEHTMESQVIWTPCRSRDVTVMDIRTPCNDVKVFTSYNTRTHAYNIFTFTVVMRRYWLPLSVLGRFMSKGHYSVARALSISIQVVLTKPNISFLVHTLHLFKGHSAKYVTHLLQRHGSKKYLVYGVTQQTQCAMIKAQLLVVGWCIV